LYGFPLDYDLRVANPAKHQEAAGDLATVASSGALAFFYLQGVSSLNFVEN